MQGVSCQFSPPWAKSRIAHCARNLFVRWLRQSPKRRGGHTDQSESGASSDLLGFVAAAVDINLSVTIIQCCRIPYDTKCKRLRADCTLLAVAYNWQSFSQEPLQRTLILTSSRQYDVLLEREDIGFHVFSVLHLVSDSAGDLGPV